MAANAVPSQRGKQIFCRRVVPKRAADVQIQVHIARPKHKAAPKLKGIVSQLMLAVAGRTRTLARGLILAPEQVQQVGMAQTRGTIGLALFVDQERKRNASLLPKQARIVCIAQSDSRQVGAPLAESLLVCAQLRDVLTAEDSTIVPQEHHHSRLPLPKRAQTDFAPIRAGKDDGRQHRGERTGHAASIRYNVIFTGIISNMKCLDCNREMTNYEAHTLAHKLSYDACDACGALWLDRGELDKMAFQVAGDIEYCSQEEAGGGQPAKNCPRCNLSLHKVKFLGANDILLDRCENSGGFWLSGGQLEKIDNELSNIMPVSGKGFADFLTNTHLPHWHKRIRRDSAETDYSVAVLPVRQAEAVGTSNHQCPVCHGNLDIYKTYGIRIETCPVCHGLWLEKGELKVLKDHLDTESWGSLRWMNDEVESIGKTSAIVSNRACPECRSTLLLSTHFANSKIVIDWCPACHGTWLDSGEFEAIAQYLRDELGHLTSKEAERKVIAEVKKIWSGNSESKIAEVLDTKAAISTLASIAIFEHPTLFAFLTRTSKLLNG